MRNELMGQRIW